MGNICRSPTAEGVFRHIVEQAGLAADFGIDSAGTHAYHVNEPADRRAAAAAERRGYSLDGIRARRFHFPKRTIIMLWSLVGLSLITICNC